MLDERRLDARLVEQPAQLRNAPPVMRYAAHLVGVHHLAQLQHRRHQVDRPAGRGQEMSLAHPDAKGRPVLVLVVQNGVLRRPEPPQDGAGVVGEVGDQRAQVARAGRVQGAPAWPPDELLRVDRIAAPEPVFGADEMRLAR